MPGGFAHYTSNSSSSSYSPPRYTPPPPYSLEEDKGLNAVHPDVRQLKVELIEYLLNAEAEILTKNIKGPVKAKHAAFFKDQSTHDNFMNTIKALGTRETLGVAFIHKNIEKLFTTLQSKAENQLIPVLMALYSAAKALHSISIREIERYELTFNSSFSTSVNTSVLENLPSGIPKPVVNLITEYMDYTKLAVPRAS